MFISGHNYKRSFKNITLYLCMSALFIMPIATIFTSLPAFADGYFDGLSIQDKYKFYVYARALNRCFQRAGKSAPESSIEDLRKGKIWSKGVPTAYIGTFPGFAGYNSSGGYFDCNSPDLINAAISQFNIQPRGRASAVEVLLCEVGYRRGGDYNKSAEDCINESGKFGKKSNGTTGKDERSKEVEIYSEGKIFQALAHLSGYRTGAENSNPGIKYLVSRSMIKGCIKDDNPQPQRHDSKEWEIPNIDSSGNLSNSYYLPGDGQGYNVGGSNNREWPQGNYDSNIPEWQCMNIHKRLVESAPKYQQALRQSAIDTACAGLAGKELEACQAGVNNKNNSSYCGIAYARNQDLISACQKGQTAKVDVPTEEGDEEKNSCGIEGMGWLFCPLIGFMSSVNDAAYGAISGFLDIKPGILSDSTSSGTRQGWEFFRDIANALFAVVFLWVIFSQISNVGLSNYGIKKILPRLIIGAVLVNISYYICQIAVDLSNILGYSIKEMLETAASGVGNSSEAAGGWSNLFAGGLALTGAAIFLFLAVGIPTVIAGMLAILLVFAILIARQAGVILLVAISPIAFAAWLLPNTEGLFKQWLKMFRGLLMVFPIVSLLYGAGKLAASILATGATSDPNNPAETMQVAALGAASIPLIATPVILRNSLSSLGGIGERIGRLSAGMNSRLTGNIKGKAKERLDNSSYGDIRGRFKESMARRRAERRTNSKIHRALDNTRFGQFLGLNKGAARAYATSSELFENDVKNEALMLQNLTASQIADIARTGEDANGSKVSKARYAAAVDQTMNNGSSGERRDILISLKGKDAAIKQRAIKVAYAKGDGNYLGNGFGDAILQDRVGSMDDLEKMAIDNAAAGNLQAEHLVQNAATTAWLAQASIDAYSKGNPNASAARHGIKDAAVKARANPNTSKNINGTIDAAFKQVGA